MRISSESNTFPRQNLTALISLAVNYCACRRPPLRAALLGLSIAFLGVACDHSTDAPEGKVWKCAIASDSAPAFSSSIGCLDDYQSLANHPLDASIPSAFSVKTVIDRADGDRLYFLDTRKYRIHYEFASEHLSGNGKPLVESISEFGLTEYYTPHRRFILGSLARYEGPGIWVWEMTPSDNASAELIALAHHKVAEACFCGKDLYFHATSLTIEAEARKLPASIKVISTAKVYESVDYQALNYATSIGRLVFTTADKLKREYVGLRDIVVLDAVPNDISVVAGIITQEFQAPLSHINVLSQDRRTPNMGLRGALTDPVLRALEGKWAKLTVGPFGYSVTEATHSEADAWWDTHKPATVLVPNMDTTVTDLRDVEEILDLKTLGLGEALKKAIPSYGGRTSHFSAFPHMDSTKVNYEKSFGIPVFYYWQHMQKNGLNDTVDRMLADPKFKADPAERDRRLKSLREAIEGAPIDSTFWNLLNVKLDVKYPGMESLHFRSSTNTEDLDGFSGAGLYKSMTGGRAHPSVSTREALLKVWASVWGFRAFEERRGRSIDHKAVGMAVLVQNAHPGEEANGAALTANPFDLPGYEPGFYINVQAGEASVARSGPSITSDQFIYHYDITGLPIVLLAHSNRVPMGTTVLSGVQTYALGTALKEIHRFFQPVYGNVPGAWYGMDTVFKLNQRVGDPAGAKPVIIMQQVRPYRGWGKQ